MEICEIFKSIQGEGHFLGRQAVFIRTMGCNLDCSFCDTKKTWDEEQLAAGREMTFCEILQAIAMLNSPENIWHFGESCFRALVVITGGEPCIQPELSALVGLLRCSGYFVAIETNGTLPTPEASWITCSPKAAANYVIADKCYANELKFVVTPEFQLSDIPEELRRRFDGHIWLQPEGSNMQAMWLKCFQLVQEDPRLRVGVQLHKLMEVE